MKSYLRWQVFVYHIEGYFHILVTVYHYIHRICSHWAAEFGILDKNEDFLSAARYINCCCFRYLASTKWENLELEKTGKIEEQVAGSREAFNNSENINHTNGFNAFQRMTLEL